MIFIPPHLEFRDFYTCRRCEVFWEGEGRCWRCGRFARKGGPLFGTGRQEAWFDGKHEPVFVRDFAPAA